MVDFVGVKLGVKSILCKGCARLKKWVEIYGVRLRNKLNFFNYFVMELYPAF